MKLKTFLFFNDHNWRLDNSRDRAKPLRVAGDYVFTKFAYLGYRSSQCSENILRPHLRKEGNDFRAYVCVV